MFANSQMYLSTTVLITIFSLRTSNSQFDEEYHRPPQPLPPQQPPKLYSPHMGTFVYPMYLRLTSRGKTQIPVASWPEEKPQRLQVDSGEEVAVAADKHRVPSHVAPLAVTMITKNTTTHFSDNETHGERINGQNTSNKTGESGEQNDNSIGVEHLPTIAVPFLDTLTHGIISEIQQHVQLIKPGTKWCGDGNKARHYDDVGVLHKTDKCCRNHDKCPYYILSHETKYGLHNDAHFTRSHCDCDASFYDCLKKVNSPFSTGVGITYFNILRMKCFRLEYPVVMCAQSTGWFSKHCVEYIVDMEKRKQWQWFDNHEF